MHDVRVGRVLRALRRRRGWRQADLARRAGVAQTTISLIERGHVSQASVATLRRVFAAVDASLDVEPRWRGGALDRLIDERHAALLGFVNRELGRRGWRTVIEATFAVYGERGSIDVLALHPGRGVLLVVEVKSEITSVEATLRALDAKVRLAPGLAVDRFGGRPASTNRLLVASADTTVLRRVRAAGGVLDAALPARGWEVRRWLRDPVGRLDGIWLPSASTLSAARRGVRSPHRVRVARAEHSVRDPGGHHGAQAG